MGAEFARKAARPQYPFGDKMATARSALSARTVPIRGSTDETRSRHPNRLDDVEAGFGPRDTDVLQNLVTEVEKVLA